MRISESFVIREIAGTYVIVRSEISGIDFGK